MFKVRMEDQDEKRCIRKGRTAGDGRNLFSHYQFIQKYLLRVCSVVGTVLNT